MKKYIYLVLLIISIFIFLYYLYAFLINKKLIRKKMYIGEGSTKNRYAKKTKYAFSCILVMCFLNISTININGAKTSLLKQIESVNKYSEIIDQKDVLKLTQSTKNYEILSTNTSVEVEDNIYVASNEALIKYDVLNETNKCYLYSEYIERVAIDASSDYVALYLGYESYTKILIFDLKLNLIDMYTINSKVVYFNVNNDHLNIITISSLSDSLKIENGDNVDILEYFEMYYDADILLENAFTISRINFETKKTKQYSVLVNNVKYAIDDDVYLVTEGNSYKFNTNKIYKLDLNKLEVTNISTVGINDIKKIYIKDNNLEIKALYNDNYIIYTFDEKLNKLSSALLDSISNEEDILNIYNLSNKTIYNMINLYKYNDYKVFKYAIINDRLKNVFIKVNNNDEIVYSYETENYLAFTNKYLIEYNKYEVINAVVVNNKL